MTNDDAPALALACIRARDYRALDCLRARLTRELGEERAAAIIHAAWQSSWRDRP